MEEIKVNLDNLTNEERETLLKLVEKGNKANKKRERFEMYCCIGNDGGIVYQNDHYFNNNDNDDIQYNEFHYRFGNYFKTKEEAEFARKKRLIYQQLKDYALGHNTEEIDWNNLSQFKWHIKYDNNCEIIRYCWTRVLNCMNQIYFTSEEIARAAVKEVGEDNIKKYLFGVNE